MVRIRSRKHRYEYFPKGAHTKYMNKYNEYVPSVTTILDVVPKKALIQWANSLGWKRKGVYAELNEAATIGTKAHNFAEKIIRMDKEDHTYNTDYEIDTSFFMKEAVYNSYLSFIKWYNENRQDIELIDIERQMSSDEYGGTCDFICRYKGKLMIFDFKTSSSFYFTQFIQLAAYVRLYEEETGETIEDVAVLRIDKKNGDIAKLKCLSDIPNGDIDFYYSVFERCLDMHRCIYVLENDWSIKHS